jgi:hypothetical protein
MRTLLLSSLIVVAGCTHSEPKPSPTVLSAPVPTVGKAVAPVAVDAELTETHAKLTLRFEGAGTGLSVVASGLDGLTLTSNGALLTEGAVKANESRTFELDFKRGPGRTNLAVSVRGTFNGAPLARVVTFAMGEGPLQQNGTTVITDDGEAIKVMNAQ